ncbi:MAG TPA: NAD(P)-dependent oxidoreductase [Exilispira sp.]|nr:NAD(P)-dependent oxidoreductase [Exilispira sp.]
MAKKVLLATEKPFAPSAVDAIKKVFNEAKYELVILDNYTSEEELKKAISDVDAVIVRSDKLTSDILESAKNLKIAVRAGAGYDNIDLKAATAKHIVVMNTPGQNSNAVAELAFGLMLYIARRGYTGKDGTELRGKTIGIQAYGYVGRYVAMIARGFGMKIIAFDPFVAADKMKEDGVEPVSSVEELYKNSDYVSIHLPLMPQTEKSVNYKLLSLMKKGATLVNTARAEVINEEDLFTILTERTDLFYCADVAPSDRKKFEESFAGRVFFTAKKMGAQTVEANNNAGIAAAKQIVNFFEKGDKTFQVNK